MKKTHATALDVLWVRAVGMELANVDLLEHVMEIVEVTFVPQVRANVNVQGMNLNVRKMSFATKEDVQVNNIVAFNKNVLKRNKSKFKFIEYLVIFLYYLYMVFNFKFTSVGIKPLFKCVTGQPRVRAGVVVVVLHRGSIDHP